MVETEKVEQRGQAVKRFRSLFDMHNIAFGSPENLGGVLLSLHEDRHFAMDFWSVVNALSSLENAPSEEEMLETVIESATGNESSALPEYEQPGVVELRQMLAGVDTSRPAELPDAIHRPDDALLQPLQPAVSADASGQSGAKTAHVTRRSIGDALAKLEQTSRELREQLAALEGQAVQGDLPFVGAPSEAKIDEPYIVKAKVNEPAVEVESAVSARAPEVPPAPAAVTAPLPVVPPAVERIERPQPAYVEPTPAPVAAVERPAAIPSAPKPVQPVAPAGAEVFARRPLSELSRRGLTLPDPDDDPSIVAPLSSYSQDRSGARNAIAVVVIAALAAGGFFAARTEAGHSMISSAGASVQSMYAKAKDSLGLSKETAQIETAPKQSDAAESAPVTPPAAVTSAPNALAPAQTIPPTAPTADTSTAQDEPSAVNPPQPQKAVVEPKPPVVASKQPVPPPPVQKAKIEPAAKNAKKQPDEEAIAAAAAAKALARQRADEAASASLERVPASIMARNLVASRVPAYPEPARTQRIEGPVELEVVVTPDGLVKYAHAIDGDRHLRGAAEEAVSRWRYRPYIENGSAIEIVTTVRVDFRLPQ